jgi:hypothetical protein
VGFNDKSKDEALTNIYSISKVLSQMGKIIIILDIFGDVSSTDLKGISTINISKFNYEYKGDFLYNPNQVFFNERGYQKIASDVAELIENEMVKIEFAKFKSILF